MFELVLSTKSGSTHTELVCARNSVNYILSAVLGRVIRYVHSLSLTHTELTCTRNSVNYILSAVLGRVIRLVHSLRHAHSVDVYSQLSELHPVCCTGQSSG